MSESSLSNDPVPQKRRSTRIVQAVPLTVSGTDALGQPFKERTTTVMVNCHGCKYQSKHYVPKNSLVNLEIPRPEPGTTPRQIQGRVVWVQRPRTVRELFQIGLEFEEPANVWGIAFPPEDWAPVPAEGAGARPSAPVAAPSAVVPSMPNVAAGGPTSHLPAHVPPPPRAARSASPTKNAESTANPPAAHAGTGDSNDVPEFQITPAPAITPRPASLITAPKPPSPAPLATPPKTAAPIPPPPVSRVSPAPPFAPVVAAPPVVPPPSSGLQQRPSAPAATAPPTVRDDHKLHVVPAAPDSDQQAVLARQMARMVTEAKENLDKSIRHDAALAVSEKMNAARVALDAQLHEAVERAIQESMQRVSDTALKNVTQQASERAAAIVDEARKNTESSAAGLDEKVRRAVQDAVSDAANDAAKRAAEQTVALQLQTSVAEAVERALRDREAATPSLSILNSPEAAEQHLENWRRNLENTAGTIRSRALEQTDEDISGARAKWAAEFEATLQAASQKIAERAGEISESAVQKASQDANDRAQALRASLDDAIATAAARIEAAGAGLQQERQRAEDAKAQLADATQAALQKTQQQLNEYLAGQYQEVSARADQLIQERAKALQPSIETSIESAARKVADRVSSEADRAIELKLTQTVEKHFSPKLDQVQRAMADLTSAESRASETHTNIKNHLHYAADELARMKTAHETQLQSANEQVEKAAAQYQKNASEHLSKLENTAELHVKNAVEQIANLESTANLHVQNAAGQIAEIQGTALTQVQHAAEELSLLQNDIREQLQSATDRADRITDTIREQAQIASEDAIASALARVQEETAKVPAQLDQTRREMVAKIEEDLSQRGSEIQHQNYDAMLKTAEWYQKKAQTSMQASLEKSVEQSTTQLRDRAAEVSSLLASELDHYRRTYVAHSTAQIEDAARDVIGREREKMTETAQMVTAGFSDQVYRATQDSLKRFESAAEGTLEKSRSDMEYNRDASLTEFQKKLDEHMTQGVEQARQFLQSHLVPMMEHWDAQRESEKQQWMQQMQKSTQDSIEAYRAKLEAASNQWLLTSATSLGQHSQSVLDTVAKAAEKRIRDTCAEVLGGVGDTLKNRLLGLSDTYKKDDGDLPDQNKR